MLRERLSSITLHSIAWPMYSSRFGTRRMSTSDAGRKPRTPRSMIRPPLTTSITVPVDGLAGLGGSLDPAPRLLEAGALLGQDQPAVLVLLGEDERVDLLAERDLVAGVDGLADRQLAGGDDALGLVADVDQHLVVVDPDDVAGDDIALLEGVQRGVVVGDDLAVDLEQQAVRAFDDLGVGLLGGGHQSCCGGHAFAEDSRPRGPTGASVSSVAPMPSRATKRGDERTPLDRDCDVLICGASFAGLAVARELAGSGADVLMIDRYEIGERQTSACGIPTGVARRARSSRSRCSRRSASS